MVSDGGADKNQICAESFGLLFDEILSGASKRKDKGNASYANSDAKRGECGTSAMAFNGFGSKTILGKKK